MYEQLMRFVFPDGQQLFILTHGVHPIGNRLYENEKSARESTDISNEKMSIQVLITEIEITPEIRQDDGLWVKLEDYYFRASSACKMITCGPCHMSHIRGKFDKLVLESFERLSIINYISRKGADCDV